MAVGSIYNDGVYRYTVLTESGNTGTVSIGAYTTESVVGDVTLPEKYISGSVVYDVTAIENGYNGGVTGSFTKCENLTGITIPKSIQEYLGYANFYQSTKLKKININSTINLTPDMFTQTSVKNIEFPYGMTEIPRSLLYNTNTLKTVHISNSIKYIGATSFISSNLKRIYIGNGVTSCSSSAFNRSPKIEEVYVDSQYVVDNFHTIFPQITSSSSPLRYVEIGDSVTSISGSAFYSGSSLREVKLGKNIREIGEKAFSRCINLKYINLDNVNYIGSYGFLTCHNLIDISNLSNLTSCGNGVFQESLGIKKAYLKWDNKNISTIYTFATTRLKNCKISSGIKKIGSHMFTGTIRMANIRIPESVISLEDNALSSMNSSYTNSGSVVFEGNCPSAGTNCLYASRVKVYYYKDTTGWSSTFSDANVPTQQVFRGYYTSGNFTYRFVDGINGTPNVEVKVADNVKLSGAVSIPTTITNDGVTYTVRYIAEEGFLKQYNITFIDLNNQYLGIGKNAFKGCSKLKTISNTTGLLDIEEGAFDGCSDLQSFVIPNTVEFLYKNTFRNCKNLTTCTLSTATLYIDECVFQNCESLQSISIPNTVDRIYPNAFENCTHLTTVTYGTGLEDIFENAFKGCYNLTSFTASSTNNLKRIKDYAFANCYKLTTPPISAATQIGQYAFYYNQGITSLTLPSTIDYIKDCAFANCNHLTTLTNNTNQYADFGNNVFYGTGVSL